MTNLNRITPLVAALTLLTACGEGTWVVETWGEEYIEDGIPAADFEDGCSATFDHFVVSITEASLLDGDGEIISSALDSAVSVDVAAAGPHALGTTPAPRGSYTSARFVVAPSTAVEGSGSELVAGHAVAAAGTVTCDGTSVTFDLTFDRATTYTCEPDGLSIPSGGEGLTQLTIHGDHLFYDDLESPDALVRGQAFVDADADADSDGILTLAELQAVSIPELGYGVGRYSDATTLDLFVDRLISTLGHVDGEGHCAVSTED